MRISAVTVRFAVALFVAMSQVPPPAVVRAVVRAVLGQSGEASKKVVIGLGVAGAGTAAAAKTGSLASVGSAVDEVVSIGTSIGSTVEDTTRWGWQVAARGFNAARRFAKALSSGADDAGRGAPQSPPIGSKPASGVLHQQGAAGTSQHANPAVGLAVEGRRHEIVTEVVRRTPVTIMDQYGRRVATAAADEEVLRQRLTSAVDTAVARALEDLGGKPVPSEKELTDILTAALLRSSRQATMKLKYDIDVTAGKIKVAYDTRRGKLTGEVNAASIAKGIASGLVGGASWEAVRRAARREPLKPAVNK
jgi:hypothetical protein